MALSVLVLAALIALAAGQIMAFIIYGVDKALAKAKGSRVPELALCAATVLFGILGSGAAMMVFRHKTAKTSFKAKFAVAVVLRLILLCVFGYLMWISYM